MGTTDNNPDSMAFFTRTACFLALDAQVSALVLPSPAVPMRVVAAPVVRTAAPLAIFKQKEKEAKQTSKADAEQEDNATMMQKVKDAGAAGIISYIFWEWAFWGVSVPVALFGFQAATGYCTRARSARLERKFGNGSVSACGGIA